LRMNAAKQLAGRRHGEYLQRCISNDACPRQPLASLLSTLCTGNWYRPAGTWLNAVMDGMTESWVEASARGLPLVTAARMCAMLLDQLMRDPDTKAALDWRRHARCPPSGEILFGGVVGFGDEVLPDLVVRQRPQRVWDSHGVSDYLETPEAKWIQQIMPDKKWMREQWLDGVKVDTHGSTEMNHERDRVSRIIAGRWAQKERFCEIPNGRPELLPGPGLAATAAAVIRARNAGRAVTIEDNLASMGLGTKEASMLGGYENLLRQAPPEKLCRIRPLVEPPQERTRVAADANVRACLKVHSAAHPEFGMEHHQQIQRRTIVVVAAKHGAGMSRLARRFRQGMMVRYDRLAATLVGQEAYHRPTGQVNLDDLVHAKGHRLVAQYLASGGRPDVKVLLTHEYPLEIVLALRAQGMNSHWYHYEPDEKERMNAIAERRVPADLMRYMQGCWRRLTQAGGYADRITTEHGIIQITTAQ
jgi:hypothetical protein